MAEKPGLRDPEIEACLNLIEGARSRIARDLSEARAGGIVNPLDWRSWFRIRPVECTLGAFALGYLLAGGPPGAAPGGGGDLLGDLARSGAKEVLRLALTSF